MNTERLRELLAQFALENPDIPLSAVTVLSFAEWFETKEACDRAEAAMKRYSDYMKENGFWVPGSDP